jgi:GntR family transcriptional regulator
MTPTHTVIDRGAGEPLYAQIAADLRAQIQSGERQPGSPLPPEQSLQEIYGVSRSVVRQALDRLAQDGLISREQGRGTIVLPATLYRRQARRAGGLRQQIAALGGELSTRVVSLELLSAPESVVQRLGEDVAWRLERVRCVDGKPLIHMVTWIPHGLFPRMAAEELSDASLHDWMRSLGLEPHGGPRHLQAVAASAQTAEHLEVAPDSPVTLLEGITRDQEGRPIEAFSAWHHPQTVFDLDAEVGRDANVSRAEELIREIRSLLV